MENFYGDDDFSWQMPGKKDYISISRGVHQQKRLILVNLNKIYAFLSLSFQRYRGSPSFACQDPIGVSQSCPLWLTHLCLFNASKCKAATEGAENYRKKLLLHKGTESKF